MGMVRGVDIEEAQVVLPVRITTVRILCGRFYEKQIIVVLARKP